MYWNFVVPLYLALLYNKKFFFSEKKSYTFWLKKVIICIKKSFENKLEILSASEGVGDKKFFCTRKKFFLSANEWVPLFLLRYNFLILINRSGPKLD